MAVKPYRCTVISWDVNHNCLGRAHLIAQTAQKLYSHVDLIGFGFTHISDTVWQPLGEASVTSLPEPKNTEDLIRICSRVSSKIQTDLVIACKARLPSLLLGYCIKRKTGSRLIVDIDDYEPSFVAGAPESKLFKRMTALELLQELPKHIEEPPYSPFWTVVAQEVISCADGITTCDTPLQSMYGGEVIPHLRDPNLFAEPSKPLPSELEEARKKNGSIVMFLGTPNRHKGVVEIAKACQQIEGVTPVYIGTIADRGIKNDITRSCQKAVLIESLSFDLVPSCVRQADLVVLLQNVKSVASAYQLPAKASDALAAGVQIVASRTEPMAMLVDMGFKGITLIESADDLTPAIKATIGSPLSKADKEYNLKLFAKTLSFDAGAETMKKLLLPPVKHSVSGILDALLNFKKNSRKKIVVVFWKQNDFGVFGRRVDMVVKYLASRSDISRVIVIEKPVSTLDLKRYKNSSNSHFRLIYKFIQKKRAGLLDTDKISVWTPLMPPGLDLAQQKDFILKYCKDALQEALVDLPGSFVGAWVYPHFRNAVEILDSLPFDHVVADIVDDHRAWPGTSEEKKRELTEQYAQVLEKSDCGVYNCKPAMNSIGKLSSKPTHLVPNGVDVDLIYKGGPKVEELRESLVSPGNWRYIIGYTGNLESKINWPLVEHVADKNKDALVLMIGSTHMAENLPQRPNIKYIGPVSYMHLKLYLQVFDVAIIPHITNDLTENMNPLKSYVYATLGIPIVATNCPNMPQLPQIRMAGQHARFAKHVRSAIVKDQNLSAEEIHAIMKAHSWESRLKDLADSFYK